MTSSKHELTCQPRTVLGRKLKQLRLKGVLPANIFGHKVASQIIQTNVKDFQKFYDQAGESTLSYLKVEGEKEPRPVFVNHIAKDPVTESLLHVTFRQVNLKEKISAPVSLVLVGESPAEKDKLGLMVQLLDEIEVEALPTDMPENIQIDVSSLDQIGAHISVQDLKIDPSKLILKTDPESLIVQIEAFAKEEVAAAPASAAAVSTEAGPTEPAAKEETPSKPEPKK
jgi:large subunit ribosomal protein L25